MAGTNILEMRNVEKSFNGVQVLRGVDFSLREGEVHALMGENGAGKSTLMKILNGVHAPTSGEVRLEGRPVRFERTADAEANGVVMIFQELSLIPTLTVAQNIFLMHEPRYAGGGLISDAEAQRRAREILSDLGEDIDPRALVGSLSVGASQMVEIAKALSKNARILVMDEPTSALSDEETQNLFRLIRRLREDGISVVYISHRMSEIFAICDRITVLRDGANVLTDDAANVSMQHLIDAMLGVANEAALEWHEREYERSDRPVLEVEGLSLADQVSDVSFSLYPGEIVGMAGLTGSGRTEIAETIFGLRRHDRGSVRIQGRPIRTTREAMAAGAALVPENRRTQGLVLEHSLRANFMLPSLARFLRGLFVSDQAGREAAGRHIERLNIATEGPEKLVRLLSGGNQQKIVLAKWLERNPRLLILDEPTIGVDIGAKADIVEIVRTIADQGTAVLVISSEFEELLAMSDRILVLHDGRLVREMDRREIESEEVLHHAVQG